MGGRWNLGGQKASLMVEDPDTGRLGAWSCQEDVHKLCAALDKRGERELALLTEITKVFFRMMMNEASFMLDLAKIYVVGDTVPPSRAAGKMCASCVWC